MRLVPSLRYNDGSEIAVAGPEKPDAEDPSKVEGTNEAGRSRPWAFEDERTPVPFPSPAD